ncbi:MAG: glycosyltransferase [uncultured bacterium]|nr:MAG: glycosyltransferase [uncultured bacterium]
MDTKIEELSIFLPTYNEEGNIGTVIKRTIEAANLYANKWELIIVDDGSTDSTNKIASQIADSDPNIRVIRHEKNSGYGASLKTGFYNSKYSWIAFTDSDGQFDFAEIKKFIEKQKETGSDLVIGYYNKRRVSLTKKITSKIWEALVLVLFGLNVRDIDCGFKLISKKVFNEIPKLESERGAFISSELLIKAKKQGFKISEIPVTHYPRLKGAGTGRKLDVIVQSFIDLLRLWKKLK